MNECTLMLNAMKVILKVYKGRNLAKRVLQNCHLTVTITTTPVMIKLALEIVDECILYL